MNECKLDYYEQLHLLRHIVKKLNEKEERGEKAYLCPIFDKAVTELFGEKVEYGHRHLYVPFFTKSNALVSLTPRMTKKIWWANPYEYQSRREFIFHLMDIIHKQIKNNERISCDTRGVESSQEPL